MVEPNAGGDPAGGNPPAPEPSPTPSPQPASWTSGIEDEGLRNHPVVQRFPTATEAARELVTVQPLIGGQKIPKPPENPKDWTEDQWGVYRRAVGVPDTVEGYGVDLKQPIPDLPEHFGYDPERAKTVLEKYRSLNLSPQQAKSLFEFHLGLDVAGHNEELQGIRESSEAATKKLMEEWGGAYTEKKVFVNQALERLAGKEAADEIVGLELKGGGVLGTSVPFLRFLATVGEKLQEDPAIGGGASAGRFRMTPEEADAKIREFRKENELILLNRSHPQFDQKNRELEMLYRQKHATAGGGMEG